MLTKRIIPCLDVKDNQVIKGKKFTNHEVVGSILELAQRYSAEKADELVFYDITASCEERLVASDWVRQVAEQINIPFCVAGGISSLKQAEEILRAGADKISINTPALQNSNLINELVNEFGQQCVVIGIDSQCENDDFFVYQFTGSALKKQHSKRRTIEWVQEVQDRGAGEIVLNCMNQDGMRNGYDLFQLKTIRKICNIPLIASGGAGKEEDFYQVFNEAAVDGALAASVFHKQLFTICDLKNYLNQQKIRVRL